MAAPNYWHGSDRFLLLGTERSLRSIYVGEAKAGSSFTAGS